MGNRISSKVLTNRRLVGHVQSILAYRNFDAECDIGISEACIVHIVGDLQESEFIPALRLQICRGYACAAKSMYAFPTVLQLFKEEASDLPRATHLDDNTFLSSNATDGVFLLNAAAKYLCN